MNRSEDWIHKAIHSIQPPAERTVMSIRDEDALNVGGGDVTIKTDEPAPLGWVTRGALSRSAMGSKGNKSSYELINRLTDPYRQSHPFWFKQYLDSQGHVNEHYHPDLVAILQPLLAAREKPSSEWITNAGLAEKLGVGERAIKRAAQEYRDSHPEWFKNFRAKNNKFLEHYHSDLADKIQLAVERMELAPEGWKTIGDLADLRGVTFQTIKDIADRLRPSYPDEFREIQEGPTRRVGYYSPIFCEAILGSLKEIDEAPSGWFTVANLAKQIKIGYDQIRKEAELFRETNPEWFRDYLDSKKRSREHLHPDLVAAIKSSFNKAELMDWLTNNALAEKLGKTFLTVKRIAETYRDSRPELFKSYRDQEYYSPVLCRLIEEAVAARELPPPGWMKFGEVADRVKAPPRAVREFLDSYEEKKPEWFKRYLDTGGRLQMHYHHELIALCEEAFRKEYATIPEEWVPGSDLAKEIGVSRATVDRCAKKYLVDHPERLKAKILGENVFNYYHPEVAELIRKDLLKRELAPAGWSTCNALASRLKTSTSTIQRLAEPYREKNPEWFKQYLDGSQKQSEHYHPDLIAAIEQELKARGLPPEGWLSASAIARDLGLAAQSVRKFVKRYQATRPDWFGQYLDQTKKMALHIHPELVQLLRKRMGDKAEHVGAVEKQKHIEGELNQFIEDVEQISTPEARQFVSLLRVFGAARCIDLLYTLYPKFRDVPVDTVHGLLGKYLGETLLLSGTGSLTDLSALEALPELDGTTAEKFKQALAEAIKDHCYQYYVARKRGGSEESAHDILNGYLDNLESDLGKLNPSSKHPNGELVSGSEKRLINHPLVSDAVLEVLTYFQNIWEIELPHRLAVSLKDGREFPDLSQRINIKEIRDKKRMLIADEMGMGKSASAILAHEAAREKARKEGRVLQPALILVPSNVAETWKRYLSSDSKRGGCFKEGEAPSVLEIESPTDFAKVDGADYVLMTQERLNERNQAVLETQWSTVIVDEVHKLKATDGVRSSLLRKIAQRQKSEDQLVLLSGTPIPNTIHDIAVTLTLLYPDRFRDTEPAELATQLIRSNLHQIRELLVPHMQAKSLAESVELPPLEERISNLELSVESSLQYRTFVEENDEMDQLSKLHFLRRWLLDPSLVNQEPDQEEDVKGEKAQALEKRLNEALEDGDTHIVVFVNDVVDGILQPSSKSPGGTALVDRLSLPKDVKRGVIHGDTSRGERKNLQDTFQSREGRMVLFVSGNTADVGVDFSAGQRVISFNEPWTRYAHEQQRSRVYRPGVQNPVTSEILVTLNTIEQGIHEYVERKYHAIEKVLQGIPLSEIEKELLEQDAATDGADASFASEIAEQYLSAWDRLMRLFSASGEVGEEDFQRFVERHGKEYAELYKEFRARSFAGNVNRVCGTVIKSFARTLDRGQVPQVLDVASGPEMLRRALPEDLAKGVTSMDINPHMFEGKTEGPTIVAGWTQIPTPDQSFDVVSSSLAWVHSSMQPRKGEVDRVKVLEEMQRVLKVGGWAVIALTPARPLKDIGQFKAAASELGFDIVEEYTGSVRTHDNAFQLPLLTLKKRENVEPKEDLVAWTKEVLERYPDAFAFEKSKSRGRHPRKMFGSCVIEATLNGTPTSLPMEVVFKDEDRKVYEEEKGLLQMARGLKSVFTEMRAIPPHVLKQHSLSRVRLDGGSYALYTPFKTTESGLLIGETVWKGL